METIMNRQQRRSEAARKRKLGIGTVIKTSTTGEHQLYWFEQPEGFSPADEKRLLDWLYGPQEEGPNVDLFGPFKTDAEVVENQGLTLLGPQCKVTEGGMWDSAWDRMQ
jgi:hypothetical protein